MQISPRGASRFCRRGSMGGVVIALLLSLVPGAAASPSFERGAGPPEWVGDLAPISKADWSYARAGQLLERAGFGGTPAEIERLAAMTPAEAVAMLVNYETIGDDQLPRFDETGIYPEGVEPYLLGVREAIPEARRNGEALGIKVKESGPMRLQPVAERNYFFLWADRLEMARYARWWASRMVATPRPLEERMTLFWHDHFATSNQKLRYYKRMVKQNETLRRFATAGFRDLLVAMAQDPAMVWFLDNRTNVKEHPNENFAREIMELFALGVGNYTEQDIREAARAFTGWTSEHLQFVDRQEDHDFGEKTIFGRTGSFDGYDVIDLILEKEAAARFIAGKLYRYFSREELSSELHEELAQVLRASDYEFKPFLTTLFLSKDFYSSASFATQIKSPVVMAVSTFRKLGLDAVPGTPDFRAFCQLQGQELFFPPNVAGWPGGRSWINPATLIGRANYLGQALFPDRVPPPVRPRAGSTSMMAGSSAEKDAAARRSMTARQHSQTVEYNSPMASAAGRRRANRTVRPDRSPAEFDLASMLHADRVRTGEDAVNYLSGRFLRVPLSEQRREALLDFINTEFAGSKIDYDAEGVEQTLRGLLHLIMSAPEYQLS